jgi:hypothetical protein
MSTRSSMYARAGLVACLITLSSCTCAPPRLLEGTQPVNIQVVWKASTSGIFVFPNSAHLGEGRDYPVWVLIGAPEDAELFIEFKGGSPLEDDSPAASLKGTAREAGKGHVVKKGKPKKGTAGKAYKYDVIVKIGNEIHRLDPYIEVDR